MTRLDAFVIASIPNHMLFGSYHNKSMKEAAEHCVSVGLAVMNAVDKVPPPPPPASYTGTNSTIPSGEVIVMGEIREPSKADLALLDRPVAFLDLNFRALRAMENMGVTTVGELTAVTRSDICNVPQIGETTVNEIVGKLLKVGLSLANRKVS